MYWRSYIRKCDYLRSIFRGYSQNVHQNPSHMHAWQALQYGDPDILQFNSNVPVPTIAKPNEILVKVHAASVNPIDPMMLKGYGSSVIGMMRQICNFPENFQNFLNPRVFPLILGRDFSGTVVSRGACVKNFKPGDEVWGAVGAQQNGSHAEYLTTSDCNVSLKPMGITHVEAASLPYAALTAWSAICTFGELKKESLHNKRVLVFGGSGGIGTFAVQILKAWGAEVTATCSTDAVEMLTNLGVENIVDYKTQDLNNELKFSSGFDFILDLVGMQNLELGLNAMKKWKNCKYVTTVSPVLQNADEYGLVPGTAKSAFEAFRDTAMGLRKGQSCRWAYFIPNGKALNTISSLVETKQILPVIDRIFDFNDLQEAYKKVLNGNARGKTVIEIIKSEEIQTDPNVNEDSTNK